jgi:hypothetical protein
VRGLQPPGSVTGRLVVDGAVLRLDLPAPFDVRATVDVAERRAELALALDWTGPDGPSRVAGALSLDALDGVRGDVDLTNVHLGTVAGEESLRLDGSVAGAGDALRMQLSARARRSSVTAALTLPLGDLPLAGWVVPGSSTLDGTLRVSALDLDDLPWLADVAPLVDGIVTGTIQLRDGQVIGQLVAEELVLAERTLPARLTLAGRIDDLEARLDVGTRREALITGTWRDGVSDVLFRFERFPLHAVVESVVGPSDVSALVTGVARVGWDPTRSDPLDLRVATEEIRLERAGVVTTGIVTFEWSEGALAIREASFTGRGAWSVRGEIGPDRLDVELVAEDADFTPLLGLVPVWARYGVGAEGSVELVGRGTLARPTLEARSDGLRVSVAGTTFEVGDATLDLAGDDLTLKALVRGVEPVGGELQVVGEGTLRLAPFELVTADLRAAGTLDVPFLGRVDDVVATITARSGTDPLIVIDGVTSAPLRAVGTLVPFDVRLVGRGIALALPELFIAGTTVDGDLRARIDDGFAVSGRIDAREARIDLAARGAARDEEALTAEPVDASRRAARELVRFDDVRILAPQRVTLSETIGSAEAAADLTLGGTAWEPRLAGTISALRGTFRFSGQDFALTRAVALFEPTRGVLPRLDLEARATFDKARAAPPGSEIRFVAPAGPRFEVVLRFEADVTRDGPNGAIGVDLVPQLTSDAIVEVASAPGGLNGGTRGLSELELLALIALGRIEVGGVTGGLASTVAGRALDTAVDLLVVGELQAALSEALGLDVVEIRTTALSDLFDGRTDPFSVSLRFGGYLSDELFASYRVGTYDDAARVFAVTNELAFTYELGPLAFDLSGRIDFPAAGTGTPVPGLTAAVRYDVSRWFAFEAGFDVGSASQTARFGVTIRW